MYAVRSGVIALFLLLTGGLVAWGQAAREPATPHGYLGILVGQEAGGSGLMVGEVTPDGPAAKAGLKQGDRIVKLANEDVRDVQSFLRAVAARKPGEKLALGIRRDGKEQTLTVTLGERPAPERTFPDLPGVRRSAFLGVQTQPLTVELKTRLNVAVEAGAVVTDVVPNSPAAKAGLKRDDVITAVNDKPVKTPADLRNAVREAGPGKEVSLQLSRGKEKMSVKAKLQEGSVSYFLPPGEDGFSTDMESMLDRGERIRELERRIEELEKRLRAMEKK